VKSPKRILIINQDSGYLMVDIANTFISSGKYEKVVLAAGKISPIKTQLDNKIKVERIALYNRSTAIKRPWSWIKASIQILFLNWFKYHDYELFLTSNPPTVPFAMLFCRNKYSTLIFDVYPDGLVSSKFISETKILFKIWARINRSFYKNAEKVYTITYGMANLIAKYCDRSKIEVIPVWPSADIDKIVEKAQNQFINENNLSGKFIVEYSGNLGKGHNLDILIKLAEKLQHEKDIIFLIIGEGWAKEDLITLSKEKSLNNIIFFPRQPSEKLAHSLSAADLSFISIEKELDKVCIPSKIYNLIKLEIPILCVAGRESELYKIISGNGIGFCFENNKIDEMLRYILLMKNDKIFYNQIVQNIHSYSGSLSNNVNYFVC
jgi:glycosyltransferase involved in cell wall biosynthesis